MMDMAQIDDPDLACWADEMCQAVRKMAEQGWSFEEIGEACLSAVRRKARRMMGDFRELRLAGLRVEGVLNEQSLEYVQRETGKLMEDALREIGRTRGALH
jgi:hypothetical protein